MGVAKQHSLGVNFFSHSKLVFKDPNMPFGGILKNQSQRPEIYWSRGQNDSNSQIFLWFKISILGSR